MDGKVRCADPGCQHVYSTTKDKCDQCSFPKEKSLQYFSSRKGGGFRGRGRSSDLGGFRRSQASKPKYVDQNVDLSNAVIASFVDFAKFLDARHDKHERIVKFSRDITIESKRAIFLLHRIQGEHDEPEVLNETKRKLDDIRFKFWFYVAKELNQNSGDPFLFHRAYTAGLQEYIEALSFYQYIKEGRLITWQEVQDNLTFTSSKRRESTRQESQKEVATSLVNPEEKVTNPPEAHQPVDPEEKSANLSEPVNPQEKSEHLQDTVKLAHPEDKLANPSEAVHLTDYAEAPANSVEQQPIVPAEQKPAINEAKAEDGETKPDVPTLSVEETSSMCLVLVPKMDFLLGIADLTGEMMRKAITSAAAGNTSVCFNIFSDLQDIYSSFLSLNRDGQREMSRKITVLESSLKKVENVCYNINVRSTEIPKHLIGTFMALHEATSKGENRRTEESEEVAFD